MLTRRAFAGAVGCTICGLTDLTATEAAAQEAPPAPTPDRVPALKIDPRIQRILRTRSDQEHLELDVARGRVKVQSPSATSASAAALVTRVRLTSPTGPATPWVQADDPVVNQPASATDPHIYINAKRFTALNGDGRIYIEVSPPVENSVPSPIPPGDWTIEIEGIEIYDGHFDAWIERDDNDPSQFFGPSFVAAKTLSTPGTGHHMITVANYDHRANPPKISPSSGRGRTRDGRTKPEVAAPGTDIWSSCSLGGCPDCNSPSGRPIPMRFKTSGTSMAAPHVAGAVALVLQRHPRLTARQIQAALIGSAVPAPGINGFSNDFGFGRVDIARCLQLLGP